MRIRSNPNDNSQDTTPDATSRGRPEAGNPRPYNQVMSRALVLLVLVTLLVPAPAQAWGYDAHRFIMDRAIELLPAELRPIFERHRAAVVERTIDPDTWQNAGFDAAESPHHFLDIDWDGYGKYPFSGLPRDYSAAVAKFGKRRIDENGTMPWRTEEMYGNLRRAFEAYDRRGAFGRFDILHYSAWLAHYVSDAHVPFHAVVNYDGQLTGQSGIHARFEAFLFERYRERLTVNPAVRPPIRDPRNYVFEAIIAGSQLAPAILASDLTAIGSRDVYDDAYYAAFFGANKAVMERCLNESISAVAAVIAGAWEDAGRPPVPLDPASAPQRRRR
jgi:hypothetical protein